jgi:hypothetical protein
MKPRRFGRLLAGAALAAAVTVPMLVFFAPDRGTSVLPPPAAPSDRDASAPAKQSTADRHATPAPSPKQASAPSPAASASEATKEKGAARSGEKASASGDTKPLNRSVERAPAAKTIERAPLPPPEPRREVKRDLAMLRHSQEILRRVERREAPDPFRYFDRLFR